jgi:hypothetical protein
VIDLATNRWRKFIKRYGVIPLSKKMGITPEAIYQWLSGKNGITDDNKRKLIKISRGELGPGDFI